MCCDNPIKLDCITSCDALILPFAISAGHIIRTSYLGAEFNCEFSINSDGYAIVHKANLNEDYAYVFSITLNGVDAACYQIKINPSAICCEKDDSLEHVIMDVTALNSDNFLNGFCDEIGYGYGYDCAYAIYNEQGIALGDNKALFFSTNVQRIPVQTAPRDTIPDHSVNTEPSHLSYDKNLLDFLQALPSNEKVQFNISPFKGTVNPAGDGSTVDSGWPVTILDGVLDPLSTNKVYGTGLQLEFPKNATFAIKINFIYIALDGVTETIGHSIIYTEKGYYIDGALVYPANVRIIANV